MLTEEQIQERGGKITASQAYRICGAKGLGQGGSTYMRELIAEDRGCFKREVRSPAIDHGNMYEPIAIEAYEKYTGLKVDDPGFILHPNYSDHVGCTPDRYIKGLKAGLEIKCPETGSTHIAFLEVTDGESLKKLCTDTKSQTVKHLYWQILFSMWVTGWEFWHFASFHPEIDNPKLAIAKIDRNEDDIKFIESRVIEALALKNEIVNRIK